MTATNHAINGAVIALIVKKPELAIPLAFLSHLLTDLVPHFNARTLSEKNAKTFITSDLFIGALLTVLVPLLLRDSVAVWITFICMWAGMSPDMVWVWRYFRKKNLDKVFNDHMSWFSRLHMKLQWSESKPGFFVEAAWLALMIYIIAALSK